MNKLKEFAKRWSEEIGLPFWINTTVESVGKEEKIRTLKEAGCAGIGLGIETGSEKLRREVLHKFMSNDKIIKTVHLLNDYNYRSTANILMGFPGEGVQDVYKTIDFVKKLNVPSYNLAFVSPYYATPVHALAKSLGYIEVWKNKPGWNGMAKKIGYGRRSGPPIKIETMTEEEMLHFYTHFVEYVRGEIPLPVGWQEYDEEKDRGEKLGVMKEYEKVGHLPFKLQRGIRK